jgi:hypothetical protein
MNTEELMKPRYKVIADYPRSDYKIGEIINCAEEDAKHFGTWPHLFSRLEWWQNRTIEELSGVKYVRVMKYRGYWREGDVVKVTGFDGGSLARSVPTGYYLDTTHYQPVFELSPATEEEYLAYKNQSK